jgi:hypothetical protein
MTEEEIGDTEYRGEVGERCTALSPLLFLQGVSPTLATPSPLYSPPELPGNSRTRSPPPGFPPPLPFVLDWSFPTSLTGTLPRSTLPSSTGPRVASANLLVKVACLLSEAATADTAQCSHLLSPSRPASFSRFCQWQKLKHSIKSTRFLAMGPRNAILSSIAS